VLAFLSTSVGDQVQFIGGTALARTHLSAGRLSEDIDLIAVDDRKSVATALDAALPRALARSHGRLTLDPMLSDVASTQPAILRTADGLSVRIQLLSARDRVVWQSERRVLVERFTDAPTAELLVPTLPAVAASKTSTRADRHSTRDLGDLWALSELGAIDQQAADLYRRHGPTNRPPSVRLFTKAPNGGRSWPGRPASRSQRTRRSRPYGRPGARSAEPPMTSTPGDLSPINDVSENLILKNSLCRRASDVGRVGLEPTTNGLTFSRSRSTSEDS
jgi:hypothetical protein